MNWWYRLSWQSILLYPLSLLFRCVASLRRTAYQLGIFKSHKFSVPVIVVGNITIGGSGKTPFVIWLVEYLKAQGYKPGIVSRGYGGRADQYPCSVNACMDVRQVGDEPVMLVERTQCPMVVAPKRVAAVEHLLKNNACDVVISDDGLQHYAMQRYREIAIIDESRSFGNGFCLPAGPLREAVSRLAKMDLIVHNGAYANLAKHPVPSVSMQIKPEIFVNVTREQQQSLAEFSGKTVHAVAAIGNPGRFFKTLRDLDIQVIEHPFADHHYFKSDDLNFAGDYPIVMTEKDAVKCRSLALENLWYLRVSAEVDGEFDLGL